MEEGFDIDISPDGKTVTIAGKGIKGPHCESLTRDIEAALGTVAERKRTQEFHETVAVKRKAGA